MTQQREQPEAESGEQGGETGMQREDPSGKGGGGQSGRKWQNTEWSSMRIGLPCLDFSVGLVQSPHRDGLEGTSCVC